MKKIWQYLLFGIVGLVVSGCEDDDPISLQPPFSIGFPTELIMDTCVIDPTPYNFHDYSFLPPGFAHMETSPGFPNELLFYTNFRDTSRNSDRPTPQVYRANVAEGSLAYVRDSRWYTKPMDWSESGRVLALWDGQFFYDSPDEVADALFPDYRFGAGYWLTDSLFIGRDNSKGIFLCSISGQVLKKIDLPVRNLTAAFGKAWGVGIDSIYQYDLATNEVFSYAAYPIGELGLFALEYDGNNTLWICNTKGLYRFRIAEKILEPFRTFECRNAYYDEVKVNFADPNLLYVWRIDYRPDKSGTIWGRETINVLDLTTLEEREIRFFE